jgi:hypothetical protein
MIVIARRLLVPVMLAVFAAPIGVAWAQSPFPSVSGVAPSRASSPFPAVKGPADAAPSSSGGTTPSSSFPAVNGSGSQFPPVNGTRASLPSATLPPQTEAVPASPGFGGAPPQGGGGPNAECMQQIEPLRDEVQRRAKVVQEASKRHATPQEACKLIGEFAKAELRFMNFVAIKQTACGIPAEVPKQMKVAHGHTEQMHKQVCGMANAPQASAGPSLSDVLGSPNIAEDAPVKRKGGSTFDTLSGNVLAR